MVLNKTDAGPAARAVVVIGSVAALIGLVGVVVADGGLTDREGTLLGWPGIELAFLGLNRLGGVLTLVGGGIAVAAGFRRSPLAVRAAAGLFAAMAVQVLVQWGRGANVLGGRGSTLSLWGGLAIGLAALASSVRPSRSTAVDP